MPARRQRLTRDETGIVSFDRRTFFNEVFDYSPGECCTFLCPYGGGKTRLAFEALDVCATPELPATILVMKPKDTTISAFIASHPDYEVIRDWPPPVAKLAKRAFGKKPPGYVLWPKDTGNPEYDDYMQEVIFRRTIRLMYNAAKKKPNIIFVDETFSMENELNLSPDLRRVWTKGRFGNGLWAASQRPAFISPWAYQAQHLFMGHDADKRSQDRYAEIGGGFDPDVVRSIIAGLERFEFLYISREDRAMCIIEAS